MSDAGDSSRQHEMTPASFKTAINNATIWEREELVRKNPLLREISKSIPYDFHTILIDCKKVNEQIFEICFDYFSMKYDNGKMTKAQCFPWRVRENIEEIETFPRDLKTAFGEVIKQILGRMDDRTNKLNLFGYPPTWKSNKRLLIGKLYINIESVTRCDQKGIEKMLTNIDECDIRLHLKGEENPSNLNILDHTFFKKRHYEISFDKFSVDNIRMIQSSDCFVNGPFPHPDSKMCSNIALDIVMTRPINFVISIGLDDSDTHEMIEAIFERENGWSFASYGKLSIYSLSRGYNDKDIIISYQPGPNALKMEVYPVGQIKKFIGINPDNLRSFNQFLSQLPYKDRSLIENIPWISCLPYSFQKMTIDFDYFQLVVEGEEKKFSGNQEFRNALAELVCHRNTRIQKLTIKGTTDDRTNLRGKLNAEEVTLTYKGIHSERFFCLFGEDKMEKLTIPTPDFIQSDWSMCELANEVIVAETTDVAETTVENNLEPSSKRPKLENADQMIK